MTADLRTRPIKSLAWLGDALFELKVRRSLLAAGDFHPRDLDQMASHLVRAETQAELLEEILDTLDPQERSVAQRAKNASIRSGGRVMRDTARYRLATALEALVAHWDLSGEAGSQRMHELLDPALTSRIQTQVQHMRARRAGKK